MTFANRTPRTLTYTSSTTRKVSHWRSGIIAFVTVIGMLMILLMLGNVIAMLIKYKNTNNHNKYEKLENISENADERHMVSSLEMALLTNEFATTINTSNSNQKYNSNNKNNNDSTASQVRKIYEINAVDENYSVATFHGNHNNLLATPPAPQRHNRFDDEINISNQRNEFSERTSTAEGIMVSEKAAGASKSSGNAEGVEQKAILQEQQSQQQQQQPQQQQPQQHQEIKELVLHRQKRYLIFPEGSSFQLVFDLIIGIVDYTSYLILGITCAVAWELPSKPPSELIEDLHEKVTEGIYRTSEHIAPTAMRRNDSIVDTTKGIDTTAGIKYVDNANVAAYTGINSGGNMQQAQMAAAHSQLSPLNAMEASYSTTTHQSNPYTSPITGFSAYRKESPITQHYSYYTGDGAYRPSNYYANTHSNHKSNNYNKYYGPMYSYNNNFADRNKHSSYYGVSGSSSNSKNQKPFGYSAVGDSTDKQPVKFANLWQHQQQQQQQHQKQPQYKKWQSWQDYDSNWQPYQQQQAQKHAKWGQQQQKWATHSKFDGTDNWWARNQQHVTNSWSAKPANWREYNVRIPKVPVHSREPVVAYAPPSEMLRRTDTTINPKADAMEAHSFDSAQRPMLTTRPKAKIYPVFGRRRRRRRRNSNAKLNVFELKLERIHLREQLRTRQKLFGKIEKLYETRGLNGTACVLRALCETGQQQKKQQKNDKAEPQSFITELLRAIFVLPTTSVSAGGESMEFEEAALHPNDLHIVDRPYREAQAHRGNCAELFAMCEHSIWE